MIRLASRWLYCTTTVTNTALLHSPLVHVTMGWQHVAEKPPALWYINGSILALCETASFDDRFLKVSNRFGQL